MVVHEKPERAGEAFELPRQPVEARGTEPSGVGAGLGGVEKHGVAHGKRHHALDETALARDLGEDAGQGVAVVVVADHQLHRDRHIGQAVAQALVIALFSQIGKIAGDHQRLGVGVVGQGMIQRAVEIRPGIAALDQAAGAGEVDIGEVEKFHRGGPCRGVTAL